jgi:capsule polysaccharide export protein KpsE/RkpR
MKPTAEKSLNLDTIGLIKIILRWRKQLGIIFALSALASFVFTLPFFMPEKFKSTAIVYPSNLVVYSTESPTEQLLQQFASETIRARIIKTFNLYQHYDIDTNRGYPITRMFTMYDANIKFNKTQYESVEIEVWDTDPLVAAAICDSLISFADKNIIALQRSKTAEVVLINRKLYEDKKREIDSMELALKEIRIHYGILDFKAQSKELSKALYKDMLGGRTGNSKMQSEANNLREKGGVYTALTDNLDGARTAINLLKTEYEKALSDLNKELTYCNVVTRPLPAEKKSAPKRSVIILLFTFSVTVFSLFAIIGIEKYKRDIAPALAD